LEDQRFKKAETAAWIGVLTNLGLAIMKGGIGFLSGSKALIADSAKSASDAAGSFAILRGIRSTKKPPHKDHSYGHGKAESIIVKIASVLLLLVGIELAISACRALFVGVSKAPDWYAMIALLLSILIKEVLFQYKYKLGKKIASQAMISHAWDHRAEVYSSGAALLGVGGALLGHQLGWTWMYVLDPVAGLFIALLVIRIGYRLLMKSVHPMNHYMLHKEDSDELLDTVLRTNGVITVDDLRAREHGYYIIVEVKISVNPRITVWEGHDIAKTVKQNLINKFGRISDVFVHVNPYDPGFPYKNVPHYEERDVPSVLH